MPTASLSMIILRLLTNKFFRLKVGTFSQFVDEIVNALAQSGFEKELIMLGFFIVKKYHLII